jgi:spermidine/putrescine transport system permease protein
MKKIITAIMLLGVMAISAGCGSAQKETLKVYNAGEYIDKSLLTKFEKENDCTIVYETFDSNEAMYTKVMSGQSYDVIIPSDYMIERFIEEDALAPIDWSLITNKDNLMQQVLNKDYDPDMTYSVPYFWGSVGILYDTDVVSQEDAAQGWNLLRNTKYAGNIYMYDSERDSFMIALKALGYSMNTTDESEIEAAYNWLVEQRDSMKPVYAGDDVIDNMISGNKAMAVVYSGDAAYIMSENAKLEYITPNEGTNMWYDSMIIMKDSTQKELAHKFINFMLDEDNALANSQEVGYSSPVKSAFEKMKTTTYAGISAYVPVENDNNEVFRYQEPAVKAIFSDLWTKVKAY